MSRYGTGDGDLDDDDEYWDSDTDEIHSLASEELHEGRPNRWTGAASTWRTLTEDDRQTYAALEALRSRDLAAHLYNAFALRRPGLLAAGRVPGPGVG